MLYGLALPNYLLFQLNYTPSLLGIVVSVYALAYILGPFILKPISTRVGPRNSTLIAAVVSVLCVGIQILAPIPGVLITTRLIDGLTLGLFWPNIYYSISKWEEDSPKERSKSYFKKFGYSWNIGCVVAVVLGYLLVFILHSDYIALVVSWFCMLLQIVAAFLMEKPTTRLIYLNSKAMAIEGEFTNNNLVVRQDRASYQDKTQDISNSLLFYPLLLVLIGSSIYQSTKNFNSFIFPIILDTIQGDPYWVYFFSASCQVLQMFAIDFASKLNAKSKYLWFMIGLLGHLFLYSIAIISQNLWIVMLSFIFTGIFSGFIYSFYAQAVIEQGKAQKSAKVSVLFETYNGVGAWLGPFAAGFIAEIDYRWSMIFIIVLVALLMLISMPQWKKIQK